MRLHQSLRVLLTYKYSVDIMSWEENLLYKEQKEIKIENISLI